jgi:hypothetical protein
MIAFAAWADVPDRERAAGWELRVEPSAPLAWQPVGL